MVKNSLQKIMQVNLWYTKKYFISVSEVEKRLEMIIQGQKEQKQVAIKHKTKIYTAVCYFAMKIERK